jgi:vancomycin permeability regulator SanA
MPSRTRLLVSAALGAGATVASLAAFIVSTNVVVARESGFIEQAGRVHERAVAIVPGASLWRGEPGALLEDRLNVALSLYRQHRVRAILVSGNGAGGETKAMQSWLARHDVRKEDVLVDPEGVRTLETARRANQAFGITSAAVCTQRSHLNRALFLARQAGIDAVGVAGEIDVAPTIRLRGIEALKSSLAFVEVHVLGKTRASADTSTSVAAR